VLATRTVMARTTGGLFLVGGVLAAVTPQPPRGPDVSAIGYGNAAVVYGLAAVAMVVGVSVQLWGDRLRPSHHHVLVCLGCLLITLAIHESTSSVAALALASVYVFVACDAAFFFSWPTAAGHVALVVLCCMTVLALRPASPWWSGLVASGVSVAVAIVVGVLSRLASEADVDVLTGVLNRRGFDRALNAEINRAARSGSRPVLILLNVDRFAAINFRSGHRVGDKVLQHIVGSWLQLLEPREILARYGGDEFAVLLPGSTEQGAMALTERLRAATSMGCSAGVTSWQPGESASFLVRRADVGLYRAKQAGRNRTVLESSLRPPLAVELADAIAAGALDVLYQPIVSLVDRGTVVGVEALLRWESPVRPKVTTEEVIRVAEEFGLIAELDRFVLHRACLDAHRLQQTVLDRALTLNVNVSGLELVAPDYVPRVEEILLATGWPAGQLVLEVTESVLDVDKPAAVVALRELRARGIRIAIDDFGTGYSSLSRIQTLPTDFLKLDASFTAAIASDSPSQPLLKALVLLGVALGLPVIAEGVETEHQAEVLASLGYVLAQGFHYGRPQPCDVLINILTGMRPAAYSAATSVALDGPPPEPLSLR
jgi:diguanylate cyclase (GGDEF)-like protein